MDSRTTPRPLQIPALVAVGALALYFGASFWVTIRGAEPKWAEFGRWEMFTWTETKSWVVEGEALIDGQWRPFDPVELFPFQFTSGPRYARSSFRESKGRMRTLAASACLRHPRHPDKVRFIDVVWKRRLGHAERPAEKHLKRKTLIEWDCGERRLLPDGRTI